ncbi:hypothetical protein KHQ88_01820 [Mycoplasmatota bacterium]|nr:hypothetical protein KHQ88_01820 [Mycoplasmatota bacterium]
MNHKDIKNKIKESALSEMPDVLHKINLDSIEIEPEQVKTKINSHFNFKLAFTAFLLIITGFFAFQIFNISDTSYPLESDMEVLAFETISSQALLDYALVEETNLSNPLSMLTQSDANDAEEYLNTMTPLIKIAELMINNKDSITYQEYDSDLIDYEKRIHFSAYNLSNEIIEYDIYYNIQNETIDGQIRYEEYAYNFTKDNESLKMFKNDNDYIEVMDNMNSENHEFTYTYFKSQTEEFSTKIKMLLLNEQYQAEFDYEHKNGMKIGLLMKRQNQTTMDVDYHIEDQSEKFNGRFNVDTKSDETTGKMMYRFIFGDSSSVEMEKPNRPHHSMPGNSPEQGPPGHNH